MADNLATMHKLGVLPWGYIQEELPRFVETELAKDQFGGAYLLGYSLYEQQVRPDGVRQSTNHGALLALTNILVGSVVTADVQVGTLRSNGQQAFLNERATALAWHTAMLRGFVVAALDDHDMHLQHELVDNVAALDRIRLALAVVNRDAQSSIDWEGSRASMLNMDIRTKAKQDLDAALAESVRKAAASALHTTPN